MKKQRHQKCRVEETNPVSPSFAPGFFFTSKQSFSHIQKMSSMHVPSSFIPHTPIALKTTRTSYQLFFGDNPRPRAGSSASHMARMKMEGHAGRFPSLSRHAWSHRPPMATFFQGVKIDPLQRPTRLRLHSGRRPELCLRLIGAALAS